MTLIKNITIHPLSSLEDLENVRALEAEIWGINDSIPTHQTLTAIKNGGIMLGAYENEKLVGFQYSFPGFNGKNVYLCSHILGTAKEYRNKGIGEQLKRAQYTLAKEKGYTSICWTYDPLESVNGYLNIGKLGATCKTYINNCYGEMTDLLNSGLPSDRFLVQWTLDDCLSKQSISFNENQNLLKWQLNEENIPVPITLIPIPKTDILFIPVPQNFRILRVRHKDIALQWRLKTREIFTEAFQKGWVVTDFIKNKLEYNSVHYYVLTKRRGVKR